MKLRRLAFRGLTRFQGDPVRIDFDALGAGLIALVGENGAGKSTALEAVPACMYRRFPTRPGGLYDHCHGRDVFIEAELAEGNRFYKVRTQVDADRKITESYLFENGTAITSGRAKEFDAEVERRFGSESLFLASAFSAQSKAGSFLEMDRRTRKDLFAQLLGLEHLQVLSTRARDRRVMAETNLAVARRLLDAAKQQAGILEGSRATLAQERKARDATALALKTAEEKEREAGQALQEARSYQEKLRGLEQAQDAARRELTLASEALNRAERMCDQAVQQAAQRRRANEAVDLDAMAAKAVAEARDRQEILDRSIQEAMKTIEEEPIVQAAIEELNDLAAEEKALQATAQRIREHEQAMDLAQATLDGAARRLQDAEGQARKEVGRLQQQADEMGKVPCVGSGWVPLANGAERRPVDLAGTCPLLATARGAKLAITQVRVSDEIKRAAQEAGDRYEAARVLFHSFRGEQDGIARRQREIEARRASLTPIAARLSDVETAKRVYRDAGQENDRIGKTLVARNEEIAQLRAKRAQEEGSIAEDLALAMMDAKARVEETEAQVTAAAERRLKAEEAARAFQRWSGVTSIETATAVAGDAGAARERAQAALAEIDQRIGRIEGAIAGLETQVVAMGEQETEVKAAEEGVGDWGLLERALGREGVQALEIDAAGPEVSSLTNELLTACYGPRFSISLETQREKKSAKGEFIEAFDVKVFDGGRQRQVEALSGGERVIVGEALGLAISIFNSRKSGIKWTSLFRDETAGALDPTNAQAYVQMLRRALRLGGFDQVIFVSHQEAVWQQADVRLIVEGGRITPEAA
jgi:DNA repair protein SbcC/Rad50